MLRRLVSLVAAVSLGACVDVSPRLFVGADTGPRPADAGFDAPPPMPDRGALDAAGFDMRVEPRFDRGPDLDGGLDMALSDTALPDTALPDTAAPDTAPPDRGPLDIGAPDDGPLDAEPADMASPGPCGSSGIYFPGPDRCLVPAQIDTSMLSPRAGHTMTRLGDTDDYVIVGGERSADALAQPVAEKITVGERVSTTGLLGLNDERTGHDAVWMDDDDDHLLVLGGQTSPDAAPSRDIVVFDPITVLFSVATLELARGHAGGTAHVGYNEHGFVIGGVQADGMPAGAEMFRLDRNGDGGWEVDGGHSHPDFETRRMPLVTRHAAVQLDIDRVLWGGGFAAEGGLVATWALYDASEHDRAVFKVLEGPAVADAALVSLGNDRVAVFGGVGADGPQADAHLIDVQQERSRTWAADGEPGRVGLTATPIGGEGWILLLGGSADASVELVRIEGDRIARASGFAATGPLSVDRRDHRALALDDDRVLVTGGRVDGRLSAEIIVLSLVPPDALDADLP